MYHTDYSAASRENKGPRQVLQSSKDVANAQAYAGHLRIYHSYHKVESECWILDGWNPWSLMMTNERLCDFVVVNESSDKNLLASVLRSEAWEQWFADLVDYDGE